MLWKIYKTIQKRVRLIIIGLGHLVTIKGEAILESYGLASWNVTRDQGTASGTNISSDNSKRVRVV